MPGNVYGSGGTFALVWNFFKQMLFTGFFGSSQTDDYYSIHVYFGAKEKVEEVLS